MRAIPLRSVPLRAAANDGTMLEYGDAIRQVVESKAGGMTLAELRHTCAILSAIETAAQREVALIEEADWSHLVSRLQAHLWPFAAVSIRDMIDEIINAPQHDPNAPKHSEPPPSAGIK
jgi:hypothetical protein